MKILIIGGGLAGTVLADKAGRRGVAVTWLDDQAAPSASGAAYGMLNPVHIRNAVLSWNAAKFFPVAKEYYVSAGKEAAREVAIWHVLSGEEEAILWRQNVESGSLLGYATGESGTYLEELIRQEPAGLTCITTALFVNIPLYLQTVKNNLPDTIQHIQAVFEMEKLRPDGNNWSYNGYVYDAIVFCEGVRAMENPYFSELPFRPCKGDVLTIRIPGGPVKEVVHRKIFLIPLGDDLYRAGSTYDWEDISFSPSEKGKKEIMESLDALLHVEYEVMDHKAGIRPAMADRKPVAGEHPFHRGLYIFNGLGSRGLIQSPFLADQLLSHMLEGQNILPEADVRRFRKRLSR